MSPPYPRPRRSPQNQVAVSNILINLDLSKDSMFLAAILRKVFRSIRRDTLNMTKPDTYARGVSMQCNWFDVIFAI